MLKLDRIIYTRGIPESIKSENGPPFNGHDVRKYATNRDLFIKRSHHNNPAQRGLVEKSMRVLLKVAHTVVVS